MLGVKLSVGYNRQMSKLLFKSQQVLLEVSVTHALFHFMLNLGRLSQTVAVIFSFCDMG